MTVATTSTHIKMFVRLEQDEDGYPPTSEESLWVIPLGEGLFQVDNPLLRLGPGARRRGGGSP